jgi:hypothetical protein
VRQENFGEFVHFRVTPTLRAQLQAHCARAGVKPTTFVRVLVEREFQAAHKPQTDEKPREEVTQCPT